MAPPHLVTLYRLTQILVVAGDMGVACDIRIHVVGKHASCRFLFSAESSAFDKIGRGLELAAKLNQTFARVDILLNILIAFGMGHDDLITSTLEVVDNPLVLFEIRLPSMG